MSFSATFQVVSKELRAAADLARSTPSQGTLAEDWVEWKGILPTWERLRFWMGAGALSGLHSERPWRYR